MNNNNRNERRKANIVSLHQAINNELFGFHNNDQGATNYAFFHKNQNRAMKEQVFFNNKQFI